MLRCRTILISLSLICSTSYGACGELFSEQSQSVHRDQFASFYLEMSQQSSFEALISWLNKEGVRLVGANHSEDKTTYVDTQGEHPLNRLAKVYSQDQILIGFHPSALKASNALGMFSPRENLVILQTHRESSDTRAPLSVTDLHELLHARVMRDTIGSYLSGILYNAKALTDTLNESTYGNTMFLSETLTFRQDYRLLLGKLKLWNKERSSSVTSKDALQYSWRRGDSGNVPIIEPVKKLFNAADARLRMIQTMNRALAIATEKVIRDLGPRLREPTMPLVLKKKLQLNAGRKLLLLEFSFDNSNGTTSALAFSISPEAHFSGWPAMRHEILTQLRAMRETYVASQKAINEAKDHFNALVRAYLANSNDLTELIGNAHESAKRLHEITYKDYLDSKNKQ